MTESAPAGAAEAPLDRAAMRSALADPRALEILTTEHASLLASRSLSYNEAFSRAAMFLSFLSATLIVIGFLIGAQGLSAAVVPVAVILLVADLFVGLATVGRLISAGREEFQCVRGMNRIRHAYRDLVPGLEPYFVSGFHDDARGVLASYSPVMPSTWFLSNFIHGMTTTIGMIATIDAMIVGALAGVVAVGLGVELPVALLIGLVGLAAAFVTLTLLLIRAAFEVQIGMAARFPSPPE